MHSILKSWFLYFFFYIITAPVIAEIPKFPSVVFINPSIAESEFFKPVTAIMQDAADNLGVKLEVVYADRNPNKLKSLGQEIINRKTPPDYLVMVNDRVIVPHLMELANSKGVHTALFNGALSEENKRRFTQGKSALKYWVGGVFPDEEQAGYLLAKILVTEVRKAHPDDAIQIIAVNGNNRSYSPIQREKGLKRLVSEYDDVTLNRVVKAYWETERANKVVRILLNSYPQTNAIWAASDEMAAGAAIAIKSAGLDKNIKLCGLDWLPVAFENIQKGQQYCSVGGHLFDGAWLMVMLLDHYNGKTAPFFYKKTPFYELNRDNINSIKKLLDSDLWGNIKFRKYSKVYNNKSDYNLGVHLLLDKVVK